MSRINTLLIFYPVYNEVPTFSARHQSRDSALALQAIDKICPMLSVDMYMDEC